MINFSRLSAAWLRWTAWSGMWNPSVVADDGQETAEFKSDDQTYHVKHEGNWWVVDETNDRGRVYPAVAMFSSFDLAERFLLLDWALLMRDDLASGSLGRDLYELGYSTSVTVTEVRKGFVEIRCGVGAAVLPVLNATVFSHLMLMPTEEIEKLVNVGMPPS